MENSDLGRFGPWSIRIFSGSIRTLGNLDLGRLGPFDFGQFGPQTAVYERHSRNTEWTALSQIGGHSAT